MEIQGQTENLIQPMKKPDISEQTNQVLGKDSNIDFDFILEQEGFVGQLLTLSPKMVSLR